jgi:hypothetical protein
MQPHSPSATEQIAMLAVLTVRAMVELGELHQLAELVRELSFGERGAVDKETISTTFPELSARTTTS